MSPPYMFVPTVDDEGTYIGGRKNGKKHGLGKNDLREWQCLRRRMEGQQKTWEREVYLEEWLPLRRRME